MLEHKDLLERVRHAIRDLREVEREIFLLRQNGDLTFQANLAGTTAGNFIGIHMVDGAITTVGTVPALRLIVTIGRVRWVAMICSSVSREAVRMTPSVAVRSRSSASASTSADSSVSTSSWV
jgi:hypothetical protein